MAQPYANNPYEDAPDYVRAEIDSIQEHDPEGLSAVYVEADQQLIPIWITPDNAFRLAQQATMAAPKRPDASQALLDLAHAADVKIVCVVIESQYEGVFNAELVLDSGAQVDIRFSDALPIIAEARLPLYVNREVVRRCGIAKERFADASELADDSAVEADVQDFASFLDSLDDAELTKGFEGGDTDREDGHQDGREDK